MEDDGKYIENNSTEDAEYGTIENVSYGDHVTTRYTSSVEGSKAILKAEKSDGTYNGYQKDKNTTFIVHLTQKPTGITAKNGASALTAQEAASKEAFDQATPAAGQAVWYYDASPKIETFASDKETKVKELVENASVAPKLYVKFAAADAQAADQTLEINGFQYQANFPADIENKDLAVPVLTENETEKTATSISINWTEVEGADSYELLIDGVLNAMGSSLSYIHEDLSYASSHTYQVRARNEKGYSAWSDEQTFTSDEDPWKDTPVPKNITWPGDIYSNRTADKAFDQIFQPGDGGFHSDGTTPQNKGVGIPLTVEYEKAYKLDKIEYYPRTDSSNGTVTKMKLETSLDGVHWKEEGIYDWQRSAAAKTMDLDTAARFIRFTALASVGDFFSASEIKVYAEANSKGFAVGSTLFNENVSDSDVTNMQQYLGTSIKDNTFVSQIQKGYGDINLNEYYDVYDYAFTYFQLDGGTQKKGKLSGKSTVSASSEQVAAGETFTVAFSVENAKNVNALGQIITYDPTKVEYISVKASDAIAQMTELNTYKSYDDNTAYVNIAYTNRGDKDLYNGSDTLVTLTMKATEAISTNDPETLGLHGLILIGPDYSTNGEIGSDPDQDIPDEPRQFTQDDFTITMTNEKLPTDDGSNISKLIQQETYDVLFDGAYGRDFEFLWDVEDNYVDGKLPEYVTLPVTLHLALKEPTVLSKISLFNANKGNGYATEVSAAITFEDGTIETKDITLSDAEQVDNSQFVFDDILTASQAVTNIDLTVQKAVANGKPTTNMLTLAELEIFEGKRVEEPPVIYTQSQLDITMTNEKLPTDDGTNVNKLIQQKTYEKLFDGNKTARDFEFLWDVESNHVDGKLPEYVTLPVTIHLALKESGTVGKLIVYNSNKANGFVTSVKAKANYKDGTSSEEKTITLSDAEKVDYTSFTFDDIFNQNKEAASVNITALNAIKSDGSDVTNMLTLAEIELYAGDKIIEEPSLDKTKLQSKIQECEAITNDGAYTQESWAAFQTALRSAKDALKTATTQEALDSALAALTDAYEKLEKVASAEKFTQDELNITITNEKLPTDDGHNVEKLIQQNSYDNLFNGSTDDRGFEFKWDGTELTVLPVTLHFELKDPQPISNVIVYNANKGNGFVTKASAKVYYADGTTNEKEITLAEDEQIDCASFAFADMFSKYKNAEKVDVMIHEAPTADSKMLTLSEIELYKSGQTDLELMAELMAAAQKAAQEASDAQKAADTAKEAAVNAKEDAKLASDRALDAQKKAEEAQAAAVKARDEAKKASSDAEGFKKLAEEKATEAERQATAAKEQADAAKLQAEAAERQAEIADKRAEAAQESATAAAGSASQAKGFADNAKDFAGTAEEARDTAEGFAKDAEKAKDAAEKARKEAVDAQDAVKEAKDAAEAASAAAKDYADTAKAQANLASESAIAAQKSAELAEAERVKAEAAKTQAEAAKLQAEEEAKKAAAALKEATELVKKAQEEADAKVAQMQKMIDQEKFKNSTVKVSMKGQAKKIKVSWKKVSGADGYEIAYSTKSSMKGKKKADVKGGDKTGATIKNLTSKKSYYIRVRAYKKVDGKKIYTKTTAKKRIRVK